MESEPLDHQENPRAAFLKGTKMAKKDAQSVSPQVLPSTYSWSPSRRVVQT